ncbi:hypothetical protein [Clostridium formicaceticum]|nr:hypothetical protein [Clostridium formicaceticum]
MSRYVGTATNKVIFDKTLKDVSFRNFIIEEIVRELYEGYQA